MKKTRIYEMTFKPVAFSILIAVYDDINMSI